MPTAEPTTPTRPYTVLEQRDLGELARTVLEQDTTWDEFVRRIASESNPGEQLITAVVSSMAGHSIFRPIGEFDARGARHAIRAAAKKVYGLVGCDRQMAGVVSKQLRLRPVVVKVRETVHIG